MHDMGSQGHTLQIDLPRDWVNLALYQDVWRGEVSRCKQWFYTFMYFNYQVFL